MKDITLTFFSLTIFIIGIIILSIFFSLTEIRDSNIEELINLEEDESVSIKAKIISITKIKDIVILRVSQQNFLDVVLFQHEKFSKGNLRVGDSVEISGKVAEYNGKNELIGEEVRLID